MSNALSTWLNNEIKRRHWSLRYVGRASGLSHATVARIANGELRGTEKTCLALSRAFNVPFDMLLDLAGIAPSKSDQSQQLHIRETGLAYEDSDSDLSTLLAVWEQLSPADRMRIVDLAQRLAALPPRIIGGDESR